MIFGKRPVSPLAQRIRRSGNIYVASPTVSLESLNLGRRRSLSLDDLGMSSKTFRNDLTSPPSLSLASDLGSPINIDDTDDDLDDLPLEAESSLSEQDMKNQTEPEVSSLSTIRENSPINSVEEWSPSPATEELEEENQMSENNKHILHLNNLEDSSGGKSRTIPKGFVQNALSKWKNMIKK